MIAEAVVGVVTPEQLPSMLAAIHQHGLGHVARVIRGGESADIPSLLERAGIPVTQRSKAVDEAERVILIRAAGRSAFAADLLLTRGAAHAWVVIPNGTWQAADDREVLVQAGATEQEAAPVRASQTPVLDAEVESSSPS